ncbi:MAG: hypothetical protein ACRD2T_00155, partial [Thermoanaerobaculia bacterium]
MGTQAAAQSQEKLQQAFQRQMAGLANWEAQVGRSERTLARFIGTTERFLMRGLQLTPVQAADFSRQQQTLEGLRSTRDTLSGIDKEAETARRSMQRFQATMRGIGRLRAMDAPEAVVRDREIRALRGGVEQGLADPQQVRRLQELEQQVRRTWGQIRIAGETIDVGRVIAWGVAWTAAYRALNILGGLLVGVTIGAFQRLAEFQQRTLVLAAELVNVNPGLPFAMAQRQAVGLLEVLTDLQPGFIGTRQQLQEILTAAIRFFGEVDLSSDQARRNFLTFANGITAAQIGINRAGSAFREVASLIEGVRRPGAQFLELLSKIDPQIEQHIRL